MDIIDYTKVEKQLRKLPRPEQIRFQTWVETIETSGIYTAQRVVSFKDHALGGQRKGERAISLSYQWRLIYRIYPSGEIKIIEVLKVTPHDYKKK